MFLPLLVSELLKVPNVEDDLCQAQELIDKVPVIKTIDDLLLLHRYRSHTFRCEDKLTSLSLKTLERDLVKAKHFQIESEEMKDMFV